MFQASAVAGQARNAKWLSAKLSFRRSITRSVAGEESGGTGTYFRHLRGTAAGDFRARLVERAGGTRAAIEPFCRKHFGRSSQPSPRLHHSARVQRPDVSGGLDVARTADGGQLLVLELGAHPVSSGQPGAGTDGG